ncbi:MAG: hypothetical protein FJ100_21255, partial [Deltaproteobacteria bacterium]|nr:hypothetical protein [Deltaproteobacteria bacterium]
YSDKGSTALRTLLLDHCNWRWLFGFENRDKIFDIHRSFKFCPVLVRKGGQTRALRAAFMRRSLDDWDMAESSAFPMQADDISMLSPKSRAMLEATQETALKSLVRISKANLRLGERNDVRYVHHEFFATADARHFVPISSAIANGYLPDSCEIWRGPDGGLVPIVEGRMLDMLQPNAMGWVSGRGRTAVWRELGASATHLEPQFLIAEKRCLAPDSLVVQGWKSSIMDVTAATNARTVISTPTRGLASVDTVRHLEVGGEFHDAALLSAMAASYTFDWLARFRVGGLHVTWFQLEDIPVPCKVAEATARLVVKAVRALACTHSRFAPEWRDTGDQPVNRRAWRHHWAITPHERLRLRCILDAAVASLYGLSIPDFAWILRDCDHPTAQVCSKPFARTLDPKGFWRVDKTQPPELRHTVLSLVAFHDLQRIGLDAFLAQHDGDGWLLPDTLRLSDYGLGHDDRAQQPQPVASALGPRFLDWQLNEDVEASWEECRRHAALIDRILGVGRNSEGDAPLPAERISASVGAAPRDHPRRPAQTDLFGERAEVDLFGEPVDRSARRRR